MTKRNRLSQFNMAKIKAIKNGVKREFNEFQWDRMPADKYGWALDVSDGKTPAKESNNNKEEVIENKTGIAKSTDEDVTVKDATAAIKSLATVAEVEAYVEGDERSGVVKATAKRIEELNS